MKILHILVLVFGSSIFAFAQNQKDAVMLTGTVYDRVGTVIRNADIQLKSINGESYKAKVNISSGNYRIEIPPGTYHIKVGANLFNLKKPFNIKKFMVVSNFDKKMILDIALDCETFKEVKIYKNN